MQGREGHDDSPSREKKKTLIHLGTKKGLGSYWRIPLLLKRTPTREREKKLCFLRKKNPYERRGRPILQRLKIGDVLKQGEENPTSAA